MRTVEAAGLAIGEGAPPRVMGVANVSPESPYDPSVFTAADAAADHLDAMIEEGAVIVDVGLASANKRFEAPTAEEERERLDLAADAIASTSRDAVASIETRHAAVAEAALDRGFDMVNDVCGFADERMPAVCADYDVAVVKMASPPDLTAPGAVTSVEAVHEAITRAGFTDRTIIDPALGGWHADKTLADDRETFMRLGEFRAYGRPILVSINRKNFLRDLAGRSTDAALPVSLAATALAVQRGASVVRSHDVAETRDAAIVGDELGRRPYSAVVDGVAITEVDTRPTGALRRQLAGCEVDPARGGDWTARVFALSGVGDHAEALAEALGPTGVEVVGTEPLVVAGSMRSLRRVRTHTEALPAPLEPALEAILEAIA